MDQRVMSTHINNLPPAFPTFRSRLFWWTDWEKIYLITLTKKNTFSHTTNDIPLTTLQVTYAWNAGQSRKIIYSAVTNLTMGKPGGVSRILRINQKRPGIFWTLLVAAIRSFSEASRCIISTCRFRCVTDFPQIAQVSRFLDVASSTTSSSSEEPVTSPTSWPPTVPRVSRDWRKAIQVWN